MKPMLKHNTEPDPAPEFAAFLALDWADEEHAFHLQVVGQSKIGTGTLEQKPAVLGPWVAKLRERFGGRPIAVGLEQSRGALIHALMAYDFLVLYPIHPTTVAKYREAFKSSGAKSDPLDAGQILEILTKHQDRLHRFNPDTVETRLLGRLVEDRRKAVNLRTTHVQALGANLKEYFPQALELTSGNLSSLKSFYYGHNVRSPEVLERVLALAEKSQALTTDEALVESGSRLTQMYVGIIQALNPVIVKYDERIQQVFEAHPEVKIFTGLPGAGPVLAPRLLAFFGTDRSRYAAALNVQSFTGVAPVTTSRGKSRVVYARAACPKFDRQTFHEFSRLSVTHCQWARNYVQYYTDKGKKYHTIIRALAYKWIRILFKCWQERTPYNEDKYMETLKKRGSIFATLHLQTNS